MAEPALETILEQIQTVLQALVADGGATAWYSPAKVYIVRTWNDSRLWDSSIEGPVYGIRRGDRNHMEDATGDSVSGGVMKAEVDVHVLVSLRYSPAGADDVPSEALVAERMQRDILRALMMDPQLAGLVSNVAMEGTGVDDQIIDDAPDGWVCAELAFRVGYTYQAANP